MFKKIKLMKKFIKIVEAVEGYFENNRDKIEKAKEALPEIKGYISDLERILERIGNKNDYLVC